jgi:hypothetical protein
LISKVDFVVNPLSATSSLPGINSGSFTFNADDEISSGTYDANGNVLTSGGMVYSYDSENHMTSATGNGKVITMVYDRGLQRQVFVAGVGDVFGNRVAKTVNCKKKVPASMRLVCNNLGNELSISSLTESGLMRPRSGIGAALQMRVRLGIDSLETAREVQDSERTIGKVSCEHGCGVGVKSRLNSRAWVSPFLVTAKWLCC